jgi:hypothetical protein
MKREFVILILGVAALSGILYAGISSLQSFSNSVLVGCTADGALRVLVQERHEKNGWPGKKINDSTYEFEKLKYSISPSLINVTNLTLMHNSGSSKAQFIVEETNPDSSRFTISVAQKLSLNPVTRISEYFALKKLKQQVGSMLTTFKQKFYGEELVYGIKIEMSRVKDSTMISTRKFMNHYPAVSEIYAMLDGVRSHIQANGGEESNAPMLNVFKEDKNLYQVMVAIPTKTAVPASETYLIKKMLANGYILVSEVWGGKYTIHQAEAALKQYVMDHKKSSPAIPFQMLLTDRRNEPDTSKWKTRLYYPVMY